MMLPPCIMYEVTDVTQYTVDKVSDVRKSTIHILASPAQPGASIVCVFSHIFHATNPPAGL